VYWYLIRHGQTESNLKQIYAGRSPEGLTTTGRQQAGLLAEMSMTLGIDEIYCSPVARTVETATIIGHHLKKKPILAPAFAELAMGPWEGKSEAEVQQNYPSEWLVWNTRPAALVLPGRETLEELLRRVLGGLELIRDQIGRRSRIMVVTHVAIIRVLLLHWEARNLNLYRTIPIPHGKIFPLADLGDTPTTPPLSGL
jgi:broad specificity phosphatase PhoE